MLTDRSVVDVKTHSRDILPSISALLEETGTVLTDLDAIVFGQGPGSFTGLRIAVGVVQGLAYGVGLPVVPVSSMAVLAQVLRNHGDVNVFVALGARLEEVYFGGYRLEGGIAIAIGEEGVTDVSELDAMAHGDWYAIITDVPELVPKIEASLRVNFRHVNEDVIPGVSELMTLGADAFARGRTVKALEATPVYLREQVASR